MKETNDLSPSESSLSQGPANPKKVSLVDLISIKDLQEMQDSFAEAANVAMVTVDANGKAITAFSNLPVLCSEVMREQSAGVKICGQGCIPTFLGGTGIVDDDFSFECAPGFKQYLVPLKVMISQRDSLIMGYLIIGPVIFMKRKSKEELADVAAKLGLDLDKFWDLVLELRVFSYKGIRSLLDMITNLTNHILGLAYGKLLIQKKISNAISVKELEKQRFSASALSDFLGLFLELVINITNGNSGSVMLLDNKKKELVIKACRGLSQDIVKNTSVKLGEGIAGLAAQTKKSFLINEGSADGYISDRLKRPNLFSSLVVPIKCHDEVYGVVNVSSDRTLPVKFDEATLEFLNKASSLAGIALDRLQG